MLQQTLIRGIQQYLDQNLQPPAARAFSAAELAVAPCEAESVKTTQLYEEPAADTCAKTTIPAGDALDDFIGRHKTDDTFSKRLLALIDQKQLSDADVYKAAGIDRRHFSKIRGNPDYRPGKQSAVALCLALGLAPGEAADLLALAGLTLSRCDTADLIVLYFLEHGIHDLDTINETLDYFGQKPLGVLA